MKPWHATPYRRTDRVEVLSCSPADGRWRVRTAPTILYAEGGGQPADQGTLGGARVVDVQEDDLGVIHVTEAPVPAGPANVVLDWGRRFDHMQQHTAQHLLTAVLQDRWAASTTSFHLGAEICAIELDVPRLPVPLLEVEAVVNAEIRAARTVTDREVAVAELAGLGVRTRGLPRGLDGPVRLVHIDGLDLNPCGGTHVRSTAELQSIALLALERARGGGTRLSFAAGGRVLALLHRARAQQDALTRLLSVAPEAHAASVERLAQEKKEADRRLRAAETELAEGLVDRLAAAHGPLLRAHRDAADPRLLQGLAGKVLARRPDATLLLTTSDGFFLLAGDEETVARLGPGLASRLGGRGGGAKGRFQGKATLDGLDDAAAWLAEAL